MKEIKKGAENNRNNTRDDKITHNDKIIKYVIMAVVMLFMSFLIALSGKVFEQTKTKDIMKILCDSFSVPGVIVICVGLLILISDTGFFSGLKYVGKSILGVFIPGMRLKQKKYEGYKEKETNLKKNRSVAMFFVTGACSLLISCVFLVLYYVL